MGSYETFGVVFAVIGSAALVWGGHALAGAADVRAFLWIVTGALALRVSSRLVGAGT